MLNKIILAYNTVLIDVQNTLKEAVKKQGDGVELAELAREIRKYEKEISNQSAPVPAEAGKSPILSEVEKTLLIAFNKAAVANDNPSLIALSKEIRKYEKTLNAPSPSPAQGL